MVIMDLITGGIGIVKGLIDNKKEKQAKQHEIDLKKIERQGELDIANQKAETDYDLEALKQSQVSWRDEYLTILLSLPFIGSFLPVVQEYVVRGWGYLDKAPVWFQASWIGVIAATFGLRWLFSRQSITQSASD